MSDYAVNAITLAAVLIAVCGVVAIRIWAHRPRPTQLVAHHTHEPAVDVQKLADTIGRLAAVNTINDYKREHHSYSPGTGLCACGLEAPCDERGRLTDYAAQLTRKDASP